MQQQNDAYFIARYLHFNIYSNWGIGIEDTPWEWEK